MVDHFIERLTGIRNNQLKNAPKLQEALLHMLNWIGDREYKIYAWSESDRNQILHETKAKKIDNVVFFSTFCEEKYHIFFSYGILKISLGKRNTEIWNY